MSAEYKCEKCNKIFCIDDMYTICEICHKTYECSTCGFPNYGKHKYIRKCRRHINETIVNCEEDDCNCTSR